MLLDDAILTSGGKPINITEWLGFFAFDVTGDLAYGTSFDQLRSGMPHVVMHCMRNGMALVGPIEPVPWLFHIAASIPGLTRDWKALQAWSEKQLLQRLKVSRMRKECENVD
jgi:cytochrome P450 family 628